MALSFTTTTVLHRWDSFQVYSSSMMQKFCITHKEFYFETGGICALKCSAEWLDLLSENSLRPYFFTIQFTDYFYASFPSIECFQVLNGAPCMKFAHNSAYCLSFYDQTSNEKPFFYGTPKLSGNSWLATFTDASNCNDIVAWVFYLSFLSAAGSQMKRERSTLRGRNGISDQFGDTDC